MTAIRHSDYDVTRLDTCEDFLIAIKKKKGLRSFEQVAAWLGVTGESVRRYRRADAMFDDKTCFKVAKLLEISPALVLTAVAAQRARTGPARPIWLALKNDLQKAAREAKKHGFKVFAVLSIGAATAGAPTPGQAAFNNNQMGAQNDGSTHMRTRRRRNVPGFARRAGAALSAMARYASTRLPALAF